MDHFRQSRPALSATTRGPGPARRTGLVLVALLALAAAIPVAAAPASQLEYQLKAGYLYNFAKFIEWPPPPLATGTTFRVGVLGDEVACAIIADTLRGRSIGDHPIEVVLLTADSDLSGFRVIFVPRSSSLTPAQFRVRQPGAPTLLVGEKDGFAAGGGEIGFVPRGDNLRYQVNLSAAERVGLKLSARLASLAEIVRVPTP